MTKAEIIKEFRERYVSLVSKMCLSEMEQGCADTWWRAADFIEEHLSERSGLTDTEDNSTNNRGEG